MNQSLQIAKALSESSFEVKVWDANRSLTTVAVDDVPKAKEWLANWQRIDPEGYRTSYVEIVQPATNSADAATGSSKVGYKEAGSSDPIIIR